jgi:choline kinase
MHAEEHMADGFVCAYSDILFTDKVVQAALDHPADVVLCVDTHWRERYTGRTQHPEHDAEKVTAEGDRVTSVHRGITSEEAHGEYIGVARLSPRGAALFREHYHRVRREFAGKPWREAKVFEKSYLILLFEEMIERGVPVHMVTTGGGYMEIDTEEDFALANQVWVKKFTEEHVDPRPRK